MLYMCTCGVIATGTGIATGEGKGCDGTNPGGCMHGGIGGGICAGVGGLFLVLGCGVAYMYVRVCIRTWGFGKKIVSVAGLVYVSRS